MIRYLIAGLLLFVGFAVAFAPAGVLDRLLESTNAADLTDTRGTLWQGEGGLLLEGHELGDLSWDFSPLSLLKLEPTYTWRLSAQDKQLQGSTGINFDALHTTTQGALAASAVNAALRPYDIYLTGEFTIQPLALQIQTDKRRISALDGQIDWNGGLVRYTLSGLLREATLPPLHVLLSMSDTGQPQAVVYAQGEQSPLILVSLNDNGFAKVGVTKLFTKLVDNPWPGSDPDHAIVIEVEEQIF